MRATSFELLFLAALAGCGGATPATDAGTVDVGNPDVGNPDVGNPDVGNPDVGNPDASAPMPAMRVQATFNGPEHAPAFACLGAREPPATGAAGDPFSLRLRDFQLEFPAAMLRMNVFRGAPTPGACAEPGCSAVSTDATGVATARGEAGRLLRVEMLAERRGPNDALNPAHVVALDVIAPAAGATLDLPSISESTRIYMPQSAGLTVAPGTAQVLGYARDCDGAPLKNALVRVFDVRGAPVTLAMEGPGAAYTNVVHRPDRAQHATNLNGEFFVVNLPVDRGPYRVEVWGAREPGAAPTRVACEVTDVWSDAVTLRDLRPLRRPAAGDPCAN